MDNHNIPVDKPPAGPCYCMCDLGNLFNLNERLESLERAQRHRATHSDLDHLKRSFDFVAENEHMLADGYEELVRRIARLERLVELALEDTPSPIPPDAVNALTKAAQKFDRQEPQIARYLANLLLRPNCPIRSLSPLTHPDIPNSANSLSIGDRYHNEV